MTAEERQPPAGPALRILDANATPEEIAAIIAVVGSLQATPPAAGPRRASAWSAPQRKVRASLPHGPGGWRSSALPR